MTNSQGFQDNGGTGGPPTERLLAGKYTSVEELEKGYLNMQTIETQNKQRLDEMEQRFLNDQRVMPGERSAARRRPEEILEENGIPPDAIGQFIEEKLAERLNPLIQGSQARENLRQRYGPDFEKLESNVANFIQQHPEIQSRYRRMFPVDQEAAMQWAIDRYQSTSGASARESASGADAGAARLDAMLPGNTGGGGGRGADLQNSQRTEKLQEAYKYAIQTGDWSRYQNLRIDEVVPDAHMIQGIPGGI